MFDENATDNTDKVKKSTQNVLGAKPAPVEGAKPKFAVFTDQESKPRRQALAPIVQPAANLEDSICSFTSVNTSLHQSDFVLQPRAQEGQNPFQIKVMVLRLDADPFEMLKLPFHL